MGSCPDSVIIQFGGLGLGTLSFLIQVSHYKMDKTYLTWDVVRIKWENVCKGPSETLNA